MSDQIENKPDTTLRLQPDVMLDAAKEWVTAWRVIVSALKELRVPEVDHNAKAIIARLAKAGMIIVFDDNRDETDGDPIGWTIVSTGDDGSVLCESPIGRRRRYWFKDCEHPSA